MWRRGFSNSLSRLLKKERALLTAWLAPRAREGDALAALRGLRWRSTELSDRNGMCNESGLVPRVRVLRSANLRHHLADHKMSAPARPSFAPGGGRGRGGRGGPRPGARPVSTDAPAPSRSSSPKPPSKAGPPRVRFDYYNSIRIPTEKIIPLTEMAVYAFKHYALFTWLGTHRQPMYPDGPTDDEFDVMLQGTSKLISDLSKNGPSSIFLALQGGYNNTPGSIFTMATDRLVLLALMAERPHLIPKILRTFPEATDPLRMAALLEPFTNSDLNSYAKTYGVVPSAKTAPLPYDQTASILSTLPTSGPLAAIAALGRLRIMHNLVLQDAVRARYGMVAILADPHVFSPGSLNDITAMVLRAETTMLGNGALYTPLRDTIVMLKRNLEVVKSVVSQGAAITQDAIRRLRLLLGVLNASDTLFDKMTSGTAASAPGKPNLAQASSLLTALP